MEYYARLEMVHLIYTGLVMWVNGAPVASQEKQMTLPIVNQNCVKRVSQRSVDPYLIFFPLNQVYIIVTNNLLLISFFDSEVCCQAQTATCLACKAGQTVEEYCRLNPQTDGCQRRCCQAQTAKCLACNAGQTVDEYCRLNPQTIGCPRACCKALTASCLACQAGQTVEEYCRLNPQTRGCPIGMKLFIFKLIYDFI